MDDRIDDDRQHSAETGDAERDPVAGAPGPGSDPDLLTLNEAAARLRVHYMTAYRWVRRGDLPAFKTGGRLRVRAADIARFIEERRIDVATDVATPGDTDWERQVERLVALLIAGDAPGARACVRAVISNGASAGKAYLRLVTPALRRVGLAVAQGEVDLSVVNRAGHICRSILLPLGDLFVPSGPSRGTAVVATPPGDAHTLAAVMVSHFLKVAGFEAHLVWTGASVVDLRTFVQTVGADVVCYSVTRPLVPGMYQALVRAARSARPDAVVIFGGQGVSTVTAQAFDGLHVDDLQDLAAHLGAP